MSRRWLPHARAILLYGVTAIAFSWPLPAHLKTHLTGPIDSDTAVYVWNQWVFQHELVENRSLPYHTRTIFSLTPKANLSLHNYTTFANLLALPLMPWLGVVATFNVVFLLLTVLTAYAMYLLARDLTGGSDAEAWLAGVLFAWCPVLITRGGGHFSLIAAAPLPIFLILLRRAASAWSFRDGIKLGVVMAWAATSDAYYGVFCLMLAMVFLSASVLSVHRVQPTITAAAITRTLEVLIVLLLGLAAAILISRGWRFTFIGRQVSFRSLYTPVLVLTLLTLLRAAIQYRPAIDIGIDRNGLLRVVRHGLVTAVACAVVLSPVLYAVGQRIVDGRWYGTSATLWRSSPPGVDLLAFVVPNPNHPLAPTAFRAWLASRPNGYLENVASLSIVALGLMAIAWRRGWRPPMVWLAVACTFGLLSLGPFVHVAGMNSHVPGPWALMRYVPLIELARSPSRFSVILMLGVAALFALALHWYAQAAAGRRRVVLGVTGALLIMELFAAPRPIYSAAVPPFYQRIAADPRPDVRVLELPFGVRDGTRSVGNFTGRSQYFQTVHHKPLIGGYLSRVSRRRIEEIRQFPILDALITLSEGGTLPKERIRELARRAPTFLSRARVGYVVIDRTRSPDQLVSVAITLFDLELVAQHGPLELYEPLQGRR